MKIFAMFLVVVSHVVSTLTKVNTYISYQDYVINLFAATTDLQQLIATILIYSGQLANTIFFVCSAWFLLDSKKSYKRKILQLLADIWVISVGILVVVFIQRGGQIDGILILKQLFPTTYGNNWYMTCYLLFLLLFPFLNFILSHLEQRILLRICIVLSMLYMGIGYIRAELFFATPLIQWVTIYFVIAYMKRYLSDRTNCLGINIMFLLIGIGGNCAIILVTNYFGLKIAFLENMLLHWNRMSSPFFLLTSIALFNIVHNTHFHSKFINHVSGLSYLVYVIHANMLLNTYYAPMLWEFVYETFGYEYLLLWILILSVFVFLSGLCCAFLYEQTIQRVIVRLCNFFYPLMARTWRQFENRLLRLH